MTMVDAALAVPAGTRHFRVLRVEANEDPPDGRRGIDFAVSSIPAKPRMVKGMEKVEPRDTENLEIWHRSCNNTGRPKSISHAKPDKY